MAYLACIMAGVVIGFLLAGLCNACRCCSCTNELIDRLHEAEAKEYK